MRIPTCTSPTIWPTMMDAIHVYIKAQLTTNAKETAWDAKFSIISGRDFLVRA